VLTETAGVQDVRYTQQSLIFPVDAPGRSHEQTAAAGLQQTLKHEVECIARLRCHNDISILCQHYVSVEMTEAQLL